MPQKRSPAEANLVPVRTRTEESKRTRVETNAPREGDSSDVSASSVSTGSVLESTRTTSEEVEQSSATSASAYDDDDDAESFVSESVSDESSSDDDEEEDYDDDDTEEEIINLGGPSKPRIDPLKVLETASNLQSRLQELLPKLMRANSELAKTGANLNMEAVGEDEQHIEMDLGLGVLEERQDSSDEDALVDTRASASKARSYGEDNASAELNRETDAMQSLMGQDQEHVRPGIQEVDDV